MPHVSVKMVGVLGDVIKMVYYKRMQRNKSFSASKTIGCLKNNTQFSHVTKVSINS